MGLLSRIFNEAPAKAASGVGAFWMTYDQTVTSITRSPQKLMREAQDISLQNRHIRAAERVIGQRFSTVEWHLEDGDDNEVTDDSPDDYRAIKELIEKPYTPQKGDPLNSTPRTRAGLWSLTCRHMGVCGNAFWYLDQAEGLAGTPLQFLYINPARMTPSIDDKGNLYGWVLDKDSRYGGAPLAREQVLQFVLEPPDFGFLGHGLVESAMSMVGLANVADRHASGVIGSGGRLAGVFSPKADAIPPEQFEQLKTDLRNIAESPDAAKRALVLQGPIDFTRTSATPQELDLLAISMMARDDILELWGVPPTWLGVREAAGLNSGKTKDSDAEIGWTNAVGPRLRNFRETLQYQLLDRYQEMGVTVELEIDEPEFDDDAPMYVMASQSTNLPLTNDERREQVGLPPLDEKDYSDLGKQVWVPALLTDISTPPAPTPPQLLPFTGGPVVPAPQDAGPPTPPTVAPVDTTTAPDMAKAPAKASPLHRTVARRFAPAIARSVQRVLDEQREYIASRVEAHAAQIARKPGDTSVWWSQEQWDKRMATAIRAHAAAIAETAAEHVARTFPAKADIKPNVLRRILANVGIRVRGINSTTRDKIARIIADNPGMGGAELGRLVRDATAFDSARAEVIARTESAQTLNAAQLAGFQEYGVTEVDAIDGDGDPECAERDGQRYDVEEAMSIEDHPNGTLDWAPVVGKAVREAVEHGHTRIDIPPPVVNIPPPIVNVPQQLAPIVHVAAPDFSAMTREWAELKAALLAPRVTRKVVERDEHGRAMAVVETTE